MLVEIRKLGLVNIVKAQNENENFRVRSVLTKKSLFREFPCTHTKTMQRAHMRSILVPPTFHIASLKRYTPKFSGPPQKLTWCQRFGLSDNLSFMALRCPKVSMTRWQERVEIGIKLLVFDGKRWYCSRMYQKHYFLTIFANFRRFYANLLIFYYFCQHHHQR